MKDKYYVDSITIQQVKQWCLKKHYLRSISTIVYCFGLFTKQDNIMIGFCSFGSPISKDLKLITQKQKPKHRYIYIHASKNLKKLIINNLKYKVFPYPKQDNVNYTLKHTVTQQLTIFNK